MKTRALTIYFLFVGVSFFGGASIHAKSLTPLEIYAKCYMQLTGLPLPLNHPSKSAVLAGTLQPEVACASLLDKAELDNTGMIAADPEGKAVLNRLYEFHRSWFPVTLIEQIQNFAGASVGHYGVGGTSAILDSTEPALGLTFNLFSQTAPAYNQVLRSASGWVAQREMDLKINPTYTGPSPFQVLFRKAADWTPTTFAGSLPVLFPTIQKGELIGIKLQDQNVTVPDYWIEPALSQSSDTALRKRRAGLQTAGTRSVGAISTFNFFESAGGGILGLQTQMLLNWGHEDAVLANGSLKLPRRWIANSLKSLLCKDLPALRESDVLSMVDSSGAANVAPFREGSSCVMCHATMDQLAVVGRNYTVARTEPGNGQRLGASGDRKNATQPNGISSQNAYLMGRYVAANDIGYNWSSTPITDFHRSVPRGKVFFRSFNGSLVNQSVNGLPQAGEALSNTDDFYQCAAKRYFEYFIGEEVQLYDRGDPRFASLTKTLSTEAVNNRLFVEKLARELRNHQSLRNMVKSILQSEYYKESK